MTALVSRAWCQLDPWTPCPWTASGAPAEVERAVARHIREQPTHAVQTSSRPSETSERTTT